MTTLEPEEYAVMGIRYEPIELWTVVTPGGTQETSQVELVQIHRDQDQMVIFTTWTKSNADALCAQLNLIQPVFGVSWMPMHIGDFEKLGIAITNVLG